MAENETGRESFVAEDSRLQSLEERLQAAQRAEAIRSGRHKQPAKGYRQGQRVLAEMIGAPVGGGVIGYVLDLVFDTFPWLMLAMMFLGFAVAVRNVFKIASERPE
jgi:ATP synthase protein I